MGQNILKKRTEKFRLFPAKENSGNFNVLKAIQYVEILGFLYRFSCFIVNTSTYLQKTVIALITKYASYLLFEL